ncbi:ATP-binding protein [Metabacillus malikii]|uniref:Uncharacterized protein YhaN n=1 Tax=Metabacillus malikii TaxID=1504265 RepID=A0ABT9ZJ56_9BACI|nr:AAA family ATPase [Metabacillus malikii]MDQ0232318.1 uncharacterized protein YhaN [Metabacillus malikii]
MKIVKLMIYGYGKFQNQLIEFESQNLQIIYGENEAGKSTIMSFIHSILFGFPTKQQAENRYEPKNGAAYGGYLIIRSNENQLYKIERIAGKGGGEVRIEEENGKVLNEEDLQQFLGGIDRDTYRSIFSFDIHGLQQIQKMKSDQIGKFLFLSSIYGGEALFTVEHYLSKQQEALFKPGGKKPLLNEALVKLKESNRKLIEAKRSNNQYQELLARKRKIENQLDAIADERKKLLLKHKELEKVHSILPILQERKWCEQQLSKLPDTQNFPEEGIQHLDSYVVALQPIETQLHALEMEKAKYERILANDTINKDAVERYSEISLLRDQLQVYKERKKNIHQKQKIVEQYEEEISIYKQRLYPHLSNEEIMSIHATVLMKESIKTAIATEQQLSHRKKLLDEQFEQAKSGLEETEWKIAELEKDLLPKAERTKLEKEIEKNKITDTAYLKVEKKQLQQQLNNRQKEFQQEKKQRLYLYIFLAVLFAFSTVWLLVEKLMLFSIIGISGFLVVLFLVRQHHLKADPLGKHLEQRLHMIDEEIASLIGEEDLKQTISQKMFMLDNDNKRKQELHHAQLIRNQQERNYDRVLSQYEKWEDECYQLQELTKDLAGQLKIDIKATAEAILEAFQGLQQLQQIILRCRKETTEVTMLEEEIVQYETKINRLIQQFEVNHSSMEEAVIGLYTFAETETKRNEQLKDLLHKKTELDNSIRSLEDKVSFIKSEKEKLFQIARVQTDDDFRKLAKAYEEKEEILKQKKWIDKQLASVPIISESEMNEEDDIDKQLVDIESRIDGLTSAEKNIQKEYSSTLIKLEDIESNGLYSNLVQSYEMEKAEVREIAEQWAIRALAKDLLSQTVERYRQTKLPALIKLIETYFYQLTGESYPHVYLPENKESFIVERNDGIRFLAEELSQATAEQLYLSIRLALVKMINEHVNLPIIIDDSFVHFDHIRAENTFKLLQHLKQENQVIFFTCHKHIASSYNTEGIISLNDYVRKQPV